MAAAAAASADAGAVLREWAEGERGTVTLLDYGVGNVRSVRNAIRRLGFAVREVTCPEDIATAERLVRRLLLKACPDPHSPLYHASRP
jgi:hypothetical protein